MTDPDLRSRLGNVPLAPLLGLVAILVFFGGLRIRVLDLPLERDEGEYAYTAQIMFDGSSPYRDSYSMKFPGIFLVYAGLMLVFGRTVVGIHLGLLFAVSLSTILVFVLARRLLDDASAVAAAACFALLSSSRAGTGFAANAEPFILPFVLAGFLLLLGALESRRAGLRLFLSGLSFGAAFLIKQHGAAFGLFGGFYLLAVLLRRRTSSPRTRIAAKFLAFAAGAALPFAAACLVFLRMGIFRQFWFYTMVYARAYISQATAREALESLYLSVSKIVLADPLIWVPAAIGLAFVIGKRWAGGSRSFLLGLAAASFLAVVPGFYFRPHYFVLAFPAAALGVGAAAMRTFESLRSRASPRPARIIVAALAVIVIGGQIYLERGMLFAANAEDASWQMYGPLPFAMNEARNLAAILRPNLSATDTVAVMGSEPQLYFYLKKKAPTGFLYLYYLTEGQPYAGMMRREFIGDIERSRPEYLIYTPSWRDEYAVKDAYEPLVRWYEDFRDRNYTLVGLADIISRRTTVYRWGEEARNYKSHSPLKFLIYRRTDVPRK